MIPLGQRLKAIRRELKLSQEAVGAQGFVSTPGWIKVENGQRQASDKLIEKFVGWLLRENYVASEQAHRLHDEFLTLKYSHHTSPFVRELSRRHHAAAHAAVDDAQLVVTGRSIIPSHPLPVAEAA